MSGNSYVKCSLLACIVVLWINCIVAAEESIIMNALVPRIDQENYQLEPVADGYNLRISLPDGSDRNEHFEYTADGPVIVGVVSYPLSPNAELMVTYRADKNGYTAKYKLQTLPGIALSISPAGLKSAAG